MKNRIGRFLFYVTFILGLLVISNSTMHSGILRPVTSLNDSEHNIVLVNAFSSKTVVGRGYSVNVTMTAENGGTFTETFRVVAYVDALMIGELQLTLIPRESTNFTFMWDTTGYAYYNYMISAVADTVPGEVDTADNTLTDGEVKVVVPGDVNADGIVELTDFFDASHAFGSNPNESNWNPNADINNDNKVEMLDFFIMSQHFGEKDFDLVIEGLVDHRTFFKYGEMQNFLKVSEVAPIYCMGALTQLTNWTGVPLFQLLGIAGVKSEATGVIFNASDGFSGRLTIQQALHPTTILALEANGTVLSLWNGFPFRLAVPCKDGWKWIRWITRIEVVNYDVGSPEEGDLPNCTFPSTDPPFQSFPFVIENITQNITTLTNSTINSFDFDMLEKQIWFNITGPTGTTGYFYIIIPKEVLWCDTIEQWQVSVSNTLIEDRKLIEDTNYTYIYFTYNHSVQEDQIQIMGIYAE